MIIYVVESGYMYEGGDIEEIFLNLDSAISKAESIMLASNRTYIKKEYTTNLYCVMWVDDRYKQEYVSITAYEVNKE